MAVTFPFASTLAFSAENPETAAEVLRQIPALPGVFALRGPEVPGQAAPEPYLTRAADLRRRIVRLLAPPENQTKRLNLRNRVAQIDYTVTGSEFESTLTLYHAAATLFGYTEARRRLRLHTPFFLRFTAENAHPRVYSTNRLSRRGLAHTYGPFPSRAAADRYCDAALDLFKLRRCYEDLMPDAAHPGCVYQEMKKCLAPCNQGHLPEGAAGYTAEAAAVKAFFETRGESLLTQLTADRERASAEMEFEAAAGLHAQYMKVKAAAGLADPIVQPIPKLRAAVVQKSASGKDETPDRAAVFVLASGCLLGPATLSTLGVRAVKEQTSVGSSLFAQPLMLQAVPLAEPFALGFNDTAVETSVPGASLAPAALSPELRAAQLVANLEAQATPTNDLALLSDHLSLFRRWYYRPEKQRAGEIFLPNADGSWPVRRILNGAARMALGTPDPIAETDREGAKTLKTKILHEGRPDVERVVHVIDPPPGPRTFTSRRKLK